MIKHLGRGVEASALAFFNDKVFLERFKSFTKDLFLFWFKPFRKKRDDVVHTKEEEKR